MLNTSQLNSPIWNHARGVKHAILKTIRDWKYQRIISQVHKMTKMRVVSGPFKGMVVSEEHVYGAPVAKLLGSYEMELHSFLSRTLKSSPENIIDVGGAEGYYAIGMALQSGIRSVIVWESLESGRGMIKRLSAQNNVTDKINILGECKEPDLYKEVTSKHKGILIMDVEGAELDLLSPRVCAALSGWHIVVEAHDFIHPGCTQKIQQMFESTHNIIVVQSQIRTMADFPLALSINSDVKIKFMDEGRPEKMYWITGTPKTMSSF